MKVLITGGAGNVGSALAAEILRDPVNYVVIADDLSTGAKEKLPSVEQSNWSFYECDINKEENVKEIFDEHKFDYVFHYAALVGVERTQENPIQVLNDIEGIRLVLEYARRTKVKRVLYSSSSEVYGEPVELPQHEERTPLNSRVPYAVVKNVGEAYFRSYQKAYGLDYTIFRFFNTYGPQQSRDFVLPRFVEWAINDQDIEIFGDGNQTRTFCYIQDNVDACLAALHSEAYRNEVINIGGARIITIRSLADLIISITGSRSKIIHVAPLEEGDMSRRQPDNSKMLKLLDRNLISLEEGIARLIASR